MSAANRPASPLDQATGKRAFEDINDLFTRHGLEVPPTRLRDELVIHLLWARYGEALDREAQS